MTRLLFSCVFIIPAFLLCGCHYKQPTQVDDAVTALRKLSSAVEVGVNNQQYSTLVIEAKSKVDLANDVLPPGDLRTQLNTTLDNYVDAGRAWAQKLDDWELLETKDPVGQALIEKYNLSTFEKTLSNEYGHTYKRTGIEFDDALHAIWSVGRQNLDKLVSTTKPK